MLGISNNHAHVELTYYSVRLDTLASLHVQAVALCALLAKQTRPTMSDYVANSEQACFDMDFSPFALGLGDPATSDLLDNFD